MEKHPTLSSTSLKLRDDQTMYKGKVRDVYFLPPDRLVSVASDRISAFDVILPDSIPHKGQVLNQLAAYFLDLTRDIIPNWLIDTPHPNISIGYACRPIPLEVVVRGNLAGSMFQKYLKGKRTFDEDTLLDGIKEYQEFTPPLVSFTTKAIQGHDESISSSEILSRGILDATTIDLVKSYAIKLFEKGKTVSEEKGLLLIDAKYEFGWYQGEVYLMDEIHTPDCARYLYLEDLLAYQKHQTPIQQLSKEWVRIWLKGKGFLGLPTQEAPRMDENVKAEISQLYINVYEKLTGRKFMPLTTEQLDSKYLESCVLRVLDN